MSITIRNNYPIDPASPVLEIERGSGKTKTVDTVQPQQSAPLGEGDMTMRIVFPKTEAELAAEQTAKHDAEKAEATA